MCKVKRTFLGLLYVVNEMLEKGIFQKDPNNQDNMLVYRAASPTHPEGWYSENIHSAVSDLFHDTESMDYVLHEAVSAGIAIESHFENALRVLSPSITE